MKRPPRKPDPTTKERILELAAGLFARKHGEEAATEFLTKFQGMEEARARTLARQAEAQQIGLARIRRGVGAEAHDESPLPPRPPTSRQHTGRRRPLEQVRRDQQLRRQRVRESRTDKARARDLHGVFRRRFARDSTREVEQAERLAKKALEEHGVNHHFRQLPKVAFFCAYLAGLDRNGVHALQALKSVNMPRRRIEQVLAAAYQPRGYSPRRGVTTGERSGQKRYFYDGRPLSGPLWQQGARRDEHPAAIRVIQVAIFLWLAKTRTKAPGFTYVVRGMGRGVFAAVCRCGKDSLFGHERGVPGALRALQQSGFIAYHQPPMQNAVAVDRGPSGHAYNVFRFRSDPEEQTLERLHERLAELPRLVAVERLAVEPALLQQRLELLSRFPRDEAPRSFHALAPPRPPPPPDDIPY